MATMKSKSVHGHGFSPSFTRATQVSVESENKTETSTSKATRSSRQPRLSFAAFAEDHPKNNKEEVQGEEEEDDDEEKRTWNLRPRKKEACFVVEVKNQKPVEPKSNRQRGIPAESPGLGRGVESNENHRLWIALSRDEIEEDLYSMSGSRPSRRPRKRTKTLQRYIDVISPGLCLVGMNADCFRVTNSPAKR